VKVFRFDDEGIILAPSSLSITGYEYKTSKLCAVD